MLSRVVAPALLVAVFAACSPQTYTVGGTVTGLQGSGLVLQNDGTNNITISKDGTFTLPGTLTAKQPYFVTVLTQPSSPAQTCTVASAQGSIVAANITSVAVSCSTGTYPIGGAVTGLAGSGLVLQDNGGDSLTVAANGTFSFATSLANGAAYAVTVSAQPATPTQSCAVTGGTGTVGTSPVTSIAVACTTTTFTIGGSITGLLGTGLVLEDNGGDDLTITSGETFAFATPVASGAPYGVTIKTQPTNPAQACTVSGGSGTVGSGNVSSVTVDCSTTSFTVGGVVTGLIGSGMVLADNGGDKLKVTSNGLFAFPTAVASGAAYAVTVSTQPATPTQTCTVTGGSGTVAGASVTSVVVSCATNTYALSGTITGLNGTGLVLQDNGGDSVTVTSGTTTFAFPTSLASGATYAIAVSTQPTGPSQTCSVTTDAGGMVTSAAITDIAVTCTTNMYTIGGTVLGLAGTGLVLEDNGGDNMKVTANGAFTFAKSVASAAAFDVTVQTQPSMPSQTCVVTGGSGMVVGSAVSTVTVNCSTNQYTVSGSVTGLTGTGLALSLNGAAGVQVGMNGKFSFPTTLLNGATYSVAITTQPSSPSQLCTLTGATGTVAAANVSNVDVACTTNTYPISVTVTGVAGTGLTLQDNGADSLMVPASGSYAFATPVASGGAYAVTVSTQPAMPAQTCTVTNGAGTVGGAAVTAVTVSCGTNTYSVGGTITGLAGTVVLQDNAGDTLIETSAGATAPPISFTFAAKVASGSNYAITVSQQPGSPSQTCTVTNDPSGTITSAAVTDVAVTCTTNTYSLSATVVGLVGSGLVVADDAGDSIPVTQNGVITLPTPYASGTTYTVSVGTQPTGPAQTCTVLGGTGTVGTSNVAGITVNCSTNLYTISGTVTGLLGSGFVLADNLGDSVPISGNGSFSMPTAYASGASYAVTVATAPSGPSQTCTAATGSGAGTVGTSNITNVAFTCVTTTYSVSVNVTGLIGSGLQLADNASDALTITQNGLSTFAMAVASQSTYAVTVLSQPASPSQTCVITSGSGTIAGSNVKVAVNCTTNTYPVSVTVTGLVGTGLKFWNNGGNGLSVTANGTFPFTTVIPSGGVYDVTVLTQPSGPTQVCTVTAPSGTITNAAVNVAVACTTSSFSVGGTVVGLVGGSVVLQNNSATTTLTVSANGAFQFPTAVASGGAYAVTVQTAPTSPVQTCTVSNGSGTVAGAAITNIAVTCSTTAFTVGGTISGLTGTGLVLTLNGANNVTVAAAATSFTFTSSVASGASYVVAVATQPSSPTQACVITGGSGTVTTANVTGISIACTTSTFTVGGTVTGLAGGTVVLQDSTATNKVSVSANGTFVFPTQASGSAYAVTVQTQPTSPTEGCAVTNGSGTVGGANVTNIIVVCTTAANFTVGGTISSLTGSGMVLQLNAANNLTVTAGSTSFTFATSLANGVAYTVTILTQPTSPAQTCTITNGTGTVTEANVTNVAITCPSVGGTPITTATAAVKVSGSLTSCSTEYSNTGQKVTIDSANYVYAGMICSGTAYVASSASAGATWNTPVALPFGSSVTELAIQGAGASTVYAAADVGGTIEFSVSTNQGVTWSTETALGSGTNQVSIAATGTSTVTVATEGGSGFTAWQNTSGGVGTFVSTTGTSEPAYSRLVSDTAGNLYYCSEDVSWDISKSPAGSFSFTTTSVSGPDTEYTSFGIGGGYIYGASWETFDTYRVSTSALGTGTTITGITTSGSIQESAVAVDGSGNGFIAQSNGAAVTVQRVLVSSTAANTAATVAASGTYPSALAGQTGSNSVMVTYTSAGSVYSAVVLPP